MQINWSNGEYRYKSLCEKCPNRMLFSGPYFPAFALNTGKQVAEKTPCLDSFHAVNIICWKLDDYDLKSLTILKKISLHDIFSKVKHYFAIEDKSYMWYNYIKTNKRKGEGKIELNTTDIWVQLRKSIIGNSFPIWFYLIVWDVSIYFMEAKLKWLSFTFMAFLFMRLHKFYINYFPVKFCQPFSCFKFCEYSQIWESINLYQESLNYLFFKEPLTGSFFDNSNISNAFLNTSCVIL